MPLNDVSLPVSATEPTLLPSPTFSSDGSGGGPLSPFLQRLQSRTSRGTRAPSDRDRPEARQAPKADSSSQGADSTRSTSSDSTRNRLDDGSRERPTFRRERDDRDVEMRGSSARTRPAPAELDKVRPDVLPGDDSIEGIAESAVVDQDETIPEELEDVESVAMLVTDLVAAPLATAEFDANEDIEPYAVQATQGTPPAGVVLTGLSQDAATSEVADDLGDGLTDELRKLLQELIQKPLPEDEEENTDELQKLCESAANEPEESEEEDADVVVAFERPPEEQPEVEISIELMVASLLPGSEEDQPSEQPVDGLLDEVDADETSSVADSAEATTSAFDVSTDETGATEESGAAADFNAALPLHASPYSTDSTDQNRSSASASNGAPSAAAVDGTGSTPSTSGATGDGSGESRSDRRESRTNRHASAAGTGVDPLAAALGQTAIAPSVDPLSQPAGTPTGARTDVGTSGISQPASSVVADAAPGQSAVLDGVGGANSPAVGRQIEISVPAGEGTTRGGSTEFADRLARAIDAAQPPTNELRVRLNPPSHGSMQIEVTMRDGELTARLSVESAQTHQLVTETLPQLRESLSKLGTSVERIDVQLAPPRAAPSGNETDNSQNGSSRQQTSGQGSDAQGGQPGSQGGRQESERGSSDSADDGMEVAETDNTAAGHRSARGVGLDRIDLVM